MRERRRSPVGLGLAAILLLATLASCGGETTEETGILLTVKTRLGVPSELDEIILEVYDAYSGEQVATQTHQPARADHTEAHRPVWVVAVVAGTPGRYRAGVDLVVRGELDGTQVGVTGAHKAFRTDEVVRQTVNLDAGETLPLVVETQPTPGATDVDPEAPVAVRFSEPMAAGPADLTGAFQLFPTAETSNLVAGALAINPDATAAAFTPDTPLAGDTEYTAVLHAWDKNGTRAHLVSAADDDRPLASSVRWTFTTGRALIVTATDPTDGATDVPVDQVIAVTFDRALDDGTVTAQSVGLTDDQGAVDGAVAYDDGSDTVTFTPSASLRELVEHTCTLTTAVTGDDGSRLSADLVLTFTTAGDAPTVVSTDPEDEATDVAPNAELQVVFSEAIDESTLLDAVTVVQSTGGPTEAVSGTGGYDAETFTATFRPDELYTAGATVTVTIGTALTDRSGIALAEDVVLSFTVGDAPAVESTTPADGASGVPQESAVSATFTRDMDPDSLDDSSVQLNCAGMVAGEVAYQAGTRTATFTPEGLLPEFAACQATLTTAVRDADGVPLLAAYSWTFTTAGQPPAVVATTPAHRTIEVPLDARRVTITFSEALDPATVTAANIRVSDNGASRAGPPQWSATDNTVTLTFAEDLAPGRMYWIGVGTGVTDLAGIPLAGPSWAVFVTRPAPAVAYVLPGNMSTDASTSSLIAVGFNVPMNGDSLVLTTDLEDLQTFTVLQDNGAVVRGSLSYYDAPRTAVFQVLGNLLPHTRYSLILLGNAIVDDTGVPLGEVQAFTFVTGEGPDGTAPALVGSEPPAGAGDVSVEDALFAIFSEPMEPMTVSGSNVQLTPAGGGGPVPATVRLVSANVAMLLPDAELERGADYTLTLRDRLRDLSGNALAASAEVPFTTEDPDTAPPALIGTMPNVGTADVPTNVAVALLFDEPVDGGTVAVSAQAGTTPVAGEVRVGFGNRAVFFAPTGGWPAGKHVTVYVAAGLADLQGNAHPDELTAAYFDTGTATDSTRPEIAGSEPAHGATEVPADTTVSLIFSEQLDLGSFDLYDIDLLRTGGGQRTAYVAAYDPGTLRLELWPVDPLSGGQQYRVVLPPAVRDLAGNAIATGEGKSSIAFRVETTMPEVVSTEPAAEGLHTAGSPLIARFSEPLDPETLSSASFTVRPEGGTMDDLVIGAVTYTEASQTALLQPALWLPPGRYTALLTRGITDLAGNRLANNVPTGYEWSFEVRAGGLYVVHVDPVPGEVLAFDDFERPVQITFNQAIKDIDLASHIWIEHGGSGLPVDGTLAYLSAEQTVLFTPTGSWDPGTYYTVHVAETLEAEDGELLGTPFSSEFSTIWILFVDDVESGEGEWSAGVSQHNAWKLIPDGQFQPDNDVWALKGRGPGSSEYERPCSMGAEDEKIRLTSPTFVVPKELKSVYVFFLHRYDIEDSDYAELTQRSSGGAAPAERTLIPAFHGNNRQYEEVVVELNTMADVGGEDAQIELEFSVFVDGQRSGAGGSCDPTGLGWHVDDVVVFGY